MNVSSVTSNWWQYLQRLQNSSTTDQSSATQTPTTTSETKSRYEGQDSETAAAFFSGIMSQGLVPVSGSTSSDTTGSSSDSDSSTNVAALTSVSSTGSSSNLETILSSFLDKVKNGTVTDDDLTALQSALNDSSDTAAQAATPPPPPPQHINRDELGALQSLLASLSDSSEESDTTAAVAGTSASSTDSSTSSATTSTDTASTTSSTSTSDTTNSTFSLASFLQKVEDGTATADDLSALADLLKEIEAESQAAHMPPPPPPQQQVAANAYDTNQGYSVASTDSTTAAQSV